MALYAISDLHLAFNVDKPMHIFGKKWINHEEKIKNNWISKINDEDYILIAGDISWGINEGESKKDLDWVNDLPGKKIISKGNHDFWWGSINKLNSLYDSTKFIQNNFYTYKDYAICGSRGCICPGADKFTEKDEKIYLRELIRMRLSLESAKKANMKKIIVMIHYPPTNEKFEESGFTELFKEFGVEKVIYGHLHGEYLGKIYSGIIDGIEYIMTASDYLNFDPLLIVE